MPLTAAEANALLNASTLNATYSFTTGPTKLALVTANGSATAAGTEVSGGTGPYSRQTCTFGTGATNGTISNTSTITFSGMPGVTVVGVEIWDSAGTPNRKWWGSLAASRQLQAGDSLNFASGSVSASLGLS